MNVLMEPWETGREVNHFGRQEGIGKTKKEGEEG